MDTNTPLLPGVVSGNTDTLLTDALIPGNVLTEDQPSTIESFAGAQAMVKAITKFFKRLKDPKDAPPLTFKEFKALPKGYQRQYKNLFGRPKTEQEQRGIAKRVAKRRAHNRMAAQSRRRNQGR